MTSDTPGVMEATERAQLLRPAEKPHHNLAGLPAWRFRILCVCVTFCGFLAALDSTVVATLLSDIGSSFNASNQASWVGSSFLLSQCCFTPIYGRLSDLIGRRNAHLSGLVLFTTGNVLCGFAPSMNFLIFAQVVAGSGAGGVQSMGNIIFSDLVDLRRRGIYQGYVNIMFGMGAALGGPFGGFMSDHFGWRIAFLGQVPLLLVGMACVYNVVPVTLPLARSTSTTKESVSWRAALRRIDYLGSLTLVLAVGSLILGLSLKTSSTNAQGQPYPWSDPRVYGLLIASVVATIAFVFVEGRIAPEPILPLQMLSRRTPAAVATVMLVMAVNAFSTIYNVPLYFTAVRLQTSAAAGARLLPYSIMIGLGSLAAGHFIKRTGKYRLVGVSLSALISLGGVGFCFWTRDAPEWLTWAAQPPAGWGYAGVLTTTLVALMTEVTQEGKGEIAVATSMTYLFRSVGQVLGVSLSAAIVQAVLERDLPRLITGPDAADVISRIRHSTAAIRDLPGPYRDGAVSAYEHALRMVFFFNFAMSILNTAAMLFIKEIEMPDQRPPESQRGHVDEE